MKSYKSTKFKKLIKYIFIIFGFSIALIVVSYITMFSLGNFNKKIIPNDKEEIIYGVKKEKKNIIEGFNFAVTPIKEHTNFLVLGVDNDGSDDSGRTDTMIVGSFNATNKKINIMSMLRDTYVVMPKERRDILKEKGRFVPYDGVMKLGEVYHYAGEELGLEFLIMQLEDILNIDIEYYVKVDYDAFKYIIDSVGGIEFDVPQPMKYDDPFQNLHIDLEKGLQVLDGNKAEMLIRYRHGNFWDKNQTPSYPMQDYGRVEVQQAFIKAFLTQTIRKENFMGSLPALIKVYYQYIETNFSISEVPKYVKYIKDLKTENISSYTLPSVPQTVNEKDFVVIKQKELESLVKEIFTFTDLSSNSKDKKIKILNGGNTIGLANNKKDFLKLKGFNKIDIGDFDGEKEDTTRIVVNKNDFGSDLFSFFPKCKIEVDESYTGDYDIVIILGKNES